MGISSTYDNNNKEISGAFKDATSLLGQSDKLQQQAKEDGMLYFKGLIPKEDILQVRLEILRILEAYELMDASYELNEAVADIEKVHRYTQEELSWNGVGVTNDIYREVQKLESFHMLAHHVNVLSMYRELFGYEAFPHPRNIGRIMLPHRDASPTPSHQDFLHIQGEEETWTCWIPLGDIPRKLGGLAVLKGSHKAGLLGVTKAPGAGGIESILCGMDYEWQTVDYTAGDVLAFNSLTVHKSIANQVPGKIRISCDFRYQAMTPTMQIEKASLEPHGPYSWDEIYEGWKNEQLKYFWKQEKFKYLPFDESIRWQKDKIC